MRTLTMRSRARAVLAIGAVAVLTACGTAPEAQPEVLSEVHGDPAPDEADGPASGSPVDASTSAPDATTTDPRGDDDTPWDRLPDADRPQGYPASALDGCRTIDVLTPC